MRQKRPILWSTALAVASFALTAWVGQVGPPARHPVPPSPQAAAVPPPQSLILQGRGPQQSANALEISVGRLPFTPLLPTSTMDLVLARSEAHIEGEKGLLDLVYVSESGAQLQVFESNYAPRKPVAADVVVSDTVQLGDVQWQYRLLSWDLPNGGQLLIHSLVRDLEGSIYVSLALHGQGNASRERSSLVTVAASLR